MVKLIIPSVCGQARVCSYFILGNHLFYGRGILKQFYTILGASAFIYTNAIGKPMVLRMLDAVFAPQLIACINK